MKNLNTRSLIFSFVILVLLEVIYFKQDFNLLILLLMAIFLFAFILLLFGRYFTTTLRMKIHRLLLPYLLVVGAAFFLVFEFELGIVLHQLIIAIVTILVYMFLINYPNLPAQYEEEKRDLTNFLSLIVMVTAFLDLLVIYDISFTYNLMPYLTYLVFVLLSLLGK
jgi:hypothetical protein